MKLSFLKITYRTGVRALAWASFFIPSVLEQLRSAAGAERRPEEDADRRTTQGGAERQSVTKPVVHCGYTVRSCVTKLFVKSERTATGSYYSREL